MPCIILLSLYTYTLKIQEGSYVLLFHTPRKKWLAKVTLEKKLHTHLGIIDISSVIGMEYGSAVRTTEGKLIFLIEPTIHDFIMKSERRTQIVYPKDLGYIAARTGLTYVPPRDVGSMTVDEDLLDALVRDHLADHPDSILAAWIATQHQ